MTGAVTNQPPLPSGLDGFVESAVAGGTTSATFMVKVDVDFVVLPAESTACMYQVCVPAMSGVETVYEVDDGERLSLLSAPSI